MSTLVVCITVVALSVVMLDVLVSVLFDVVSEVVAVVVAVARSVLLLVLPVVVAVAVELCCVVDGGVGQSASKEGVTVLSSFGTNAGIRLQRYTNVSI